MFFLIIIIMLLIVGGGREEGGGAINKFCLQGKRVMNGNRSLGTSRYDYYCYTSS